MVKRTSSSPCTLVASSTPAAAWAGSPSSWRIVALDVVGVDLDDDLLEFARKSAPSIRWVHADLATMRLDRRFDVVAMPGNVMVFCRPEDRLAIIGRAAAHLEPGGYLVAGFDVEHHDEALSLDGYDGLCAACDLELVQRWSTWQGDSYRGESYAVSVHQRSSLSAVG